MCESFGSTDDRTARTVAARNSPSADAGAVTGIAGSIGAGIIYD